MTIKVPGKLMVAGEFAVLVPNQHLAVTAVDRFVYATIADAETGKLTLEDFGLDALQWNYNQGEITIGSEDNRLSFVQKAMEFTCTYLEEQGTAIDAFELSIHSELDDESGIKYGLGSSAAVVSAVVSAIMAHFSDGKMEKDIIFKLAALAHAITQGSGSGADVAASVYGGILKYSSFQADWLIEEYEKASSISELILKKWTYLDLKPIKLPDTVHFCVGWTGKPASTAKLVDIILKQKDKNPHGFKKFLQSSEKAVHELLTGMEEEDLSLLFSGVKENRLALSEIGRQANISIETELLTALSDLAEKLGGAGKPSGAGGGDCGIAFMPTKEQADKLFHEWERAGIKPLAIKSHPEGAVHL